MKKVLFILTMVVLASCNTSTSTNNDPDSTTCVDSIQCDSLKCDSTK